MAWKLEGTYFETCSCDVVCPCTASLALGADLDRCRVTLVFNVAHGEVEGTDVSGLVVAAVADTPKVMSDGNWRLGVFIDAAASDEQAEKLGAVFSGQLGGPMAGARAAGRREPRRRARVDRGARGRPEPQRQDRRRGRLRDRGHRPLRRGVRRAGEAHRDLPSGRLGADDRQGDALAHQRVRHRVRGQGGLLELGLLVGGVT